STARATANHMAPFPTLLLGTPMPTALFCHALNHHHPRKAALQARRHFRSPHRRRRIRKVTLRLLSKACDAGVPLRLVADAIPVRRTCFCATIWCRWEHCSISTNSCSVRRLILHSFSRSFWPNSRLLRAFFSGEIFSFYTPSRI